MSTPIPTPKPYREHDNHRPRFAVLLVEDDRDDEALTIRALRRTDLPILIKVVHDGDEALRTILGEDQRGASELPQLVLLDLKIPKVSGLDVLARIKSAEPTKTVPVVCMTSSDEEPDLVAAYSRGANAFIRKPSDYDRYMDVVATTARWWLDMNRLPQIHARFVTQTYRSVHERP